MLTGAGFCNYPGLAHLFRQKHLTDDIVDFMGTCVVQIFTLQINFRPAQIPGHLPGIVEP